MLSWELVLGLNAFVALFKSYWLSLGLANYRCTVYMLYISIFFSIFKVNLGNLIIWVEERILVDDVKLRLSIE